MAAAVVTIICIALIIMGGMTLSQGILTTADSTALSFDSLSVREGEIMRTSIDVLRAAQLSWGDDLLRVTVKNNGHVKLAGYDKWDVIMSYEDSGSTLHSTWLPYTPEATPGDNEWRKARIGLGPVEGFEPDILNPEEDMVILAWLDPPPGDGTTGDISITTPNGVCDSITLVYPGYMRLTPQSEDAILSGTAYYELVEAAPADGAAMTATAEFTSEETGRKLLYNADHPARTAKFIYPLIGIDEIPAGTWTVYYRCRVSGTGFPQSDGDTRFNIDILIRQANGDIRGGAPIDTEVASANITMGQAGNWITVSREYDFPGYEVIDQNDYLEIDFYGETLLGPVGGNGTMELRIDDNILSLSNQTRIEAY